MGQKIVAVLMLIVVGAILADLVFHPQGTGVLVNGLSSLWKTGIQGAAGQNVTG
jgi:L-asparagine transporter-like permease